jgi:hypothetical protein
LALHDRAYVSEYMKKRGHVALFGVKYHAEMAWIERKWCSIKNNIRGDLNGTLPRLRDRLRWAFPLFRLEDAHKAARHCRETMAAYRSLSSETALAELAEAEKKQRCHRKEVELINNKLRFKSSFELSEKQLAAIASAEKARDTREEYEEALARFKRDFYAQRKRERRAARTADEREKDNASSLVRKDKAKKKRSELIGPELPGNVITPTPVRVEPAREAGRDYRELLMPRPAD